jgi:pimeloyl-ACP methyl ester carboxylesterase
VNGVRGCYTESGAGEPVVLLATTLVRARPYGPVVRRLASRFHVFSIDLPGCGGAERLPRTWTFEEYAEWVGDALAALTLEGVTLIGHSNSGGIALVAAATLPAGRVRRVVLVDAVGAIESPSYWLVLLGRAVDGILEPWLSLTGWHHLAYNAFAHTRNFFGQIKASIERDLRRYAPRVTVPTLVAWGARDHTMPPDCADVLRALLPQPHSHVSPTGSHDWIITNPDEFAGAVGAFVANT